jgi:ABC-type antimicrobial peptide transport system permease subunit
MSDSRNRFFLPLVTLLSAVAGMVLLIACVNVANLLLSRAAVRQREMAIRQSLGAGRARLFRETLAEGLVLATGGLILGIFFGYWTGRAVELLLPSVHVTLPRAEPGNRLASATLPGSCGSRQRDSLQFAPCTSQQPA